MEGRLGLAVQEKREAKEAHSLRNVWVSTEGIERAEGTRVSMDDAWVCRAKRKPQAERAGASCRTVLFLFLPHSQEHRQIHSELYRSIVSTMTTCDSQLQVQSCSVPARTSGFFS